MNNKKIIYTMDHYPNRLAEMASELYVLADLDNELKGFVISYAHKDLGVIGHLVFVRFQDITENVVGARLPLFELQQILPASSPLPYPAIEASGVLWTRQAAVEAHQSLIAFVQGASRRDLSSPSVKLGGSRHETL